MVVWPISFSAGANPVRYPKPVMPTRPIAMPTGTRSSISANRLTKPIRATASLLTRSLHGLDFGIVHQVRMEDQPIRSYRDQQHGGDVADPRHQEERPHRHLQVHGDDVAGAGVGDLVEQR